VILRFRFFGGLCVLLLFLLEILVSAGPCLAQFSNVEPDARVLPWSSITRLALESGVFPPAYRPVSEGELARLMAGVRYEADQESSSALEREISRIAWIHNRFETGNLGLVFHGCPCKENPINVRISGRMIGGYSELGNPVGAEGGLSFAAGHNVFLEPSLELSSGKIWSALAVRFGGRLAGGGVNFSEPGMTTHPLTWPNWSPPTGRYSVREARLKDGAWNMDISRALVGVNLGNWALSAGWDHRRSGPGFTGTLNLGFDGESFPALTARRTESFKWSGFLTHLAPDQTLLRAGVLSRRTVDYTDIYGVHFKEANPMFFQWLVGWNVTSWFRANLTHTVMATAREGSLWPDLLQINFPVIGTTWRESDSGPITDRIFTAQFEFRWRNAPWPILPSSAGRLFWEYGGTDFLPSGPAGLVPELSIPASIAGIELVGPRWDLVLEYTELRHENVIWYYNGGYAEGYTQNQWVMGHSLGGSGESLTAVVRGRPGAMNYQVELLGRAAHWGLKGFTPGTGSLDTVALTMKRTPRLSGTAADQHTLLWSVTAEWNREHADPYAYFETPVPDSQATRNWWRLIFKIGI